MYTDYHDRPEDNLGPLPPLAPVEPSSARAGHTADDFDYDEKARFIDYNLTPYTPKALGYVAILRGILAEQESRQRQRRPTDLANYEAQVAALASNLAWSVINSDQRPIVYQRSNDALAKKTRYKQPWLTRAFKDVVDAFTDEDLIEHETGEAYKGRRNPFAKNAASRIYITGRLREIVREEQLRTSDFERILPPECIIMRDVKEDWYHRGKDIDYPDDADTERMRAEVEAINDWLAQANLGFDLRFDSQGRPVDLTDRRLRRIFSRGSWQSGGRLYGGFWMPMPKADRKAHLRIDNEPIVGIDYSQMAPRIAYAACGVDPGLTDLYAIPGLEGHRDGAKKLMGAMFFAGKLITKKPKGLSDLLPKEAIGTTLGRITRHHRAIGDSFYRGLGHVYMYTESEILIDVLQELRLRDIVALPIHDAVVVKKSKASVTQEVMEQVFYQQMKSFIQAKPE